MSGTERYTSIPGENTGTLPVVETPPKNARVLVIDDDKLIRGFLQSALHMQNYDTETAEDCDQAKKILADKHFDLILCDINLPGMSGNEFLPFCKQNYPDTEIILITGQPGIDDAVHAVKDGAFDYLPKPIAVEKLYDRVKAALLEASQKNTMGDSPAAGYKIVRNLGAGTMGVVLLVRKNDNYYAMKILRSVGDMDSDKNVKRFMREADILAQINHPNIVKIFEYGLSPKENVPYFIMEFVDGNPLNEHITAGDLSIKDKLVIIKQIASALAFIHEQGILHRDVKPANIIVMDDKTVKLTDFGIARIAESELTITHEMLGTPAYMSPEAFNAAREKDQRSDIFSLGTICYELLTGIKPFSGETIAELMDSIQHEKPIEPMRIAPEIRPYVQDIMAKMLAKSPEDRFSSAAEVLRALEKEYVDFDNSSITRKFFRALLLRKPTWR